MNAQRIAAWSEAVGPDDAARRIGVSLSTLGRYASGQTKPTGNKLHLIRTAVEAWESQGAFNTTKEGTQK